MLGSFILSLLRTPTVEPVAFLIYIAYHLFAVSYHTGFDEVVCTQMFAKDPELINEYRDMNIGNLNETIEAFFGNDSETEEGKDEEIECEKMFLYPDAEIQVQEKLSEWNMFFSLANILPGIFVHITLGAWSDKHGRKINIMLGILGVIINAFPFIVVFEYSSTPMWILLITSFVSGATGYMGLIIVSSFAYLADIVHDKNDLTVRMVVLNVVTSFSSVIGSLLAAVCMDYVKYSYIVVMTLGFCTLSFFYALVRLEQLPPAVMRKLTEMRQTESTVELTEKSPHSPTSKEDRRSSKALVPHETHERTKKTRVERIQVHLKDLQVLFFSVVRTYTKPRSKHHRKYLLLIAVILFLHLLSGMDTHVTSLYVFRSPLSWNGEHLAYFEATRTGIHFLGNVIGIVVLKKVLKWRETTIILLALGCHIAQQCVMAFAQSTWMLYFAVIIGSLNPLFKPTIKSLVTQMVERDEVGKSFIMFGIGHDVGLALSSVISNEIYKATVHFMPGFVFTLCAGCLFTAFLLMLYIHMDTFRLEEFRLERSHVSTAHALA